MDDWFRDYHIDTWRGFFTTGYLMFPHDPIKPINSTSTLPAFTSYYRSKTMRKTWRAHDLKEKTLKTMKIPFLLVG